MFYWKNFNPSTLINIAETISSVKDNPEVSKFASLISKYATGISLEEKEIERIIIVLNKLRKSEEVIDYVKRIFIEKPSLVTNIVLLENKARATMDMAKICIDTGKSYKINNSMKAKAWERARVYLDDAERDLMKALDNAEGDIEKEYIKRDCKFSCKNEKNSSETEKVLKERWK